MTSLFDALSRNNDRLPSPNVLPDDFLELLKSQDFDVKLTVSPMCLCRVHVVSRLLSVLLLLRSEMRSGLADSRRKANFSSALIR